jgi:hypothetical protein
MCDIERDIESRSVCHGKACVITGEKAGEHVTLTIIALVAVMAYIF